VEIQPLKPAEARRYLKLSAAPSDRDRKATGWDAVFEDIRKRPNVRRSRNLITTMSSPLMVALARATYNETGKSPQELYNNQFADDQAIRGHLLDTFISSRFGDDATSHPRLSGTGSSHAERWLVYLAYLVGQQTSSNLAWWRLWRLVPSWFLGLIIGLPAGIAWVLMDGFLYSSLYGSNVGSTITLALLVGVVGMLLATFIFSLGKKEVEGSEPTVLSYSAFRSAKLIGILRSSE
jgi:hypothetical protein